MPKVVVPNKALKDIQDALKEVYLLKTALMSESNAKLEKRIDKIRAILRRLQNAVK